MDSLKSRKKKQLRISTSGRCEEGMDRSDMTTPINVTKNAYTAMFSFYVSRFDFGIFPTRFQLLCLFVAIPLDVCARLHGDFSLPPEKKG